MKIVIFIILTLSSLVFLLISSILTADKLFRISDKGNVFKNYILWICFGVGVSSAVAMALLGLGLIFCYFFPDLTDDFNHFFLDRSP